jgi:small subunit ribosomal protein S6
VPLYDCTFILNPQLEEAALDGYIKSAGDLIDRNGGKVVNENRIGIRRLAYEIKKLSQGYYVSLVFEGGGRTVGELERQLRLEEGCLRFLTCLAPDVAGREDKPSSPSQKTDSAAVSRTHQHDESVPANKSAEEKNSNNND